MEPLPDLGALLAGLPEDGTIVLHSGCAEPPRLARELARFAASGRGLHLLSMMPMGHSPYGDTPAAAQFDVATFFPGRGLRRAINEGRARPLRHALSTIPGLFDTRALRAHAVLLQVSPPDATGCVSLGVSVDYMRAVLAQSPVVVAEINPRMPTTSGDTRLSVEHIDWYVEGQDRVTSVAPAKIDGIDARIAGHVAALVGDGAVLQIGIGSLPDAVLGQLGHLQHLGLHSGIVTDAVRPLIESGVIDNSKKSRFAGVCVTTMAAGTEDFYAFLHRNRAIEFHPCSMTHAPQVLRAIDGLCAINSALQVDLSGRVNAETANGKLVSLPGGLPDFAAGATCAPGGQSIVAIRSTFGAEEWSNVVDTLGTGTPVTVGPECVDCIVTEYGVARVRGVSRMQLAHGLIAVAHPRHREALLRQLVARGRHGPVGSP